MTAGFPRENMEAARLFKDRPRNGTMLFLPNSLNQSESQSHSRFKSRANRLYEKEPHVSKEGRGTSGSHLSTLEPGQKAQRS